MARVTTLRDVARESGFDPSTVSRVLSGNPAQAVRPETRKKIVDTARRLGYRPNGVARSLRLRRTQVISLVAPGIDNIGFAGVIHGVQRAAAERGCLVLLADADALHGDKELYARLVLESRIDGVLAAFGTVRDPLVRQLAERVPVVAVNRAVAGIEATVVADDYAGSRMAVDHLVSMGHTAIAHLRGPLEIDTARRRLRGYRDAMAAHGLRVAKTWVADGAYTEAGGRQAAAEMLAAGGKRPTAVFAASLVTALGALGAFRQAGVDVPGDLAVVAMDEHPVATHTDPPLTTVAMPLEEMGAAAAGLLLDMVEGAKPRRVLIDTQPRLVVRESTAGRDAPANGQHQSVPGPCGRRKIGPH